jgi:hypothetical protein
MATRRPWQVLAGAKETFPAEFVTFVDVEINGKPYIE